MSLLDVPNGVKPVTGLLYRPFRFRFTGDGDQAPRTVSTIQSVDIGPGFATGLHGIQFFARNGVFNDPKEWRYALQLNPDVADWGDEDFPEVIAQAVWGAFVDGETEQSGDGIAIDRTQDDGVWFPAPFLTVRPWKLQAQLAHQSSSLTLIGATYYSIYEVSDAQFLRVAGVSLSRG